MTKRARGTYTPELKEQMVKLYEGGKFKNDIVSEYDLTATAFNTLIKRSQVTGSFSEKDNRSSDENKLIKANKGNQQLMMGNDILKQVALILGRK